MKNSGLGRFIRNIYAFAFVNALMLLSPVYAIFMQENGVSDLQLSTILMVYSVAVVVAQFPIAWLNKAVGFKTSIIIGQILKGSGFICWFLIPTYHSFIFGMFLWGLQAAIYNVSYESMFYDELKARNHRHIYAKILGRRKVISTIGSALSAGGSLMLFLGYNFILWATIAALALSIFFILRIQTKSAPAKAVSVKKQVGFFRLLKTGIRVCIKTPCIFYIMLVATLSSNVSYLDDFFGPIALDIGMRAEYVGGLTFFIMLCYMAGQAVAHKFEKLKDIYLYGMISLAGLLFVAFSEIYSVPGLLVLGLAYVIFTIVNVVTYARFQDFVPTNCRPVALSLYSLLNNAQYFGVLFIFGLGGEIGGWSFSIMIMGLAGVLLGAWAMLWVGQKCTPENQAKDVVRAGKTSSVSPSQF